MKKSRLKHLLIQAIAWIEKENADFFTCEVSNEYEWFENAMDITKEEMNELGIELREGEDENEE